MATADKPAKNHIVDFIDDKEYYSVKRHKAEVEKGTYAIYIFSTFMLLSYVFFITINAHTHDWFDLVIGILVIALYYLLGYYSNYKPFTSFVSIICLLVIVTLLEILVSSQINIKGSMIKLGWLYLFL